jgi:NADPH-dependent curcumin reductase CurA
MADLTQTAANVALGASTTPTRVVQFGVAVTQGNALYLSATDGKYYKADALTPGAQDAYGIVALPGSTPGQSLINLGATLAKGEVYAVSATAGAIAPIGDITSGQYVTVIGIATTTALLNFQPSISNATEA